MNNFDPYASGLFQSTHFKVLGKIADGGMGQIYRAYDTRLDREVALKFLWDNLAGDPETVERFVAEARAAGKLRHVNIVSIDYLGQYQKKPFIAMELVEGENLEQRVEREGPLSARDASDDRAVARDFDLPVCAACVGEDSCFLRVRGPQPELIISDKGDL